MNHPHWAPEETHHLLRAPLTEIQNINTNHTRSQTVQTQQAPLKKLTQIKKQTNKRD